MTTDEALRQLTQAVADYGGDSLDAEALRTLTSDLGNMRARLERSVAANERIRQREAECDTRERTADNVRHNAEAREKAARADLAEARALLRQAHEAVSVDRRDVLDAIARYFGEELDGT